MRQLALVIAAVALLMLAGCFQVETVVRVNPDGSGTVVETMMLSREMISSMNEMMQAFSAEGGDKPEPMELFEPEKLKAQAAKMGEGVSYLSGEKCETEKFSGYRATYAFKDINRLSIGGKGGDTAGEGGVKKPSMPIRFRFAKGPPAELTIEQPEEGNKGEIVDGGKTEGEDEKDGAPPGGNGPVSAEEAKQIAEMFMGMKVGFAVEVNGAIIETNATHREGNRITIVDFDLAKFGSSLPQLEKLKRLERSSPEEAKELMKAFPGMRVDTNDRVQVVFGK